ncbi:MAG TPA: hypothetical protein VNH11_13545 [Pirellulales bacterium]|nr:hypothetical protein [Pirellulales bacterium]
MPPNPYAAPSSDGLWVESDWPTLLDLLEAAVVLAFINAALVALLFLVDDERLYFALYFFPVVPALLAAHRYRQRRLQNPPLAFALVIALELTALGAAPNYFVAAEWGVSGHPAIEVAVGSLVTLACCFLAQRSSAGR